MRSLIALCLMAAPAGAAGIAPLDMSSYVEVPATCQTEEQFYSMVIGPKDSLYPLYLHLNAALCSKPDPSYDVVGYIPNDPQFHWDVPELLKPRPVAPPSPVPLQGSLGFLSVAMFALWGVKRRMKNAG